MKNLTYLQIAAIREQLQDGKKCVELEQETDIPYHVLVQIATTKFSKYSIEYQPTKIADTKLVGYVEFNKNKIPVYQ